MGGMSESEIALIVVTIALIMCDCITGIINASLKGELSSKKLKQGLLKKFVYIILMFVCWLIDFASLRANLGFIVPMFASVTCGIILVEVTSIFENCCAINPDIKNSHIFEIINSNHKTNGDDKNDESN